MSTNLTKAGKLRKRPAREGEGAPEKYNKEIAEKLLEAITHKTLKEACDEVGIKKQTYYNWLLKYDEFFDLSTKSRKIKGISHFSETEEILEEIRLNKDNPDYRSDMARLRLDFHLRLAGKANQGLFGDTAKNQVNVTVDNKDVDVPARMSEKEWLEDK